MQRSFLIAIGLILAWVGERIVEGSTARLAFTGMGALLMVAALGSRLMKMRADAGRAGVHRTLAVLHAGALVSLALYLLQSDLMAKWSGTSLASNWPKLAGVLAVMWPALVTASLIPTLLVELAFASMAKAPKLETGRVHEALFSGLGLASVLIFVFSAQYVATERDVKADFSYFRVAKVGEATQKLVASLDAPVEVFLFFPPASDVAEAVNGYFKDLQAASPQLRVSVLDHALEPAKSKELGVSGNGTVVFKKGGRKESLFIGIEVEKSKSQLRGLDAEVQKRLLQVAKARRTVYFTAGHGERTQNALSATDQRATTDVLHKAIEDQNFDVRPLTSAEGLGQEVPQDAAAVFIIGPTESFSLPEATALSNYGKRGGRLFIALDPENRVDFAELMEPLGLAFRPQSVTTDRGAVRMRESQGKGDRVNLATRTFSSHPITSSLGRSGAALVFLGAGPVEELPSHPADLSIDVSVRSQPDAWNDASGNFEFDEKEGETRKSWGLVTAVERRAKSGPDAEPMRVMVLGDSDAVGDVVLPQVTGNQLLVLDGFKWLLGDEQLAGATNSEVDVPLSRTRQQDSAWFYVTTFLAPVAVVGVGFIARRRPLKATRKKAQS
jgi:hypothetical protein